MGLKVNTATLARMLGTNDRQIRRLVEKGALMAEKDDRGHYEFDFDIAEMQFNRYEMLQGRGNARPSTPTHEKEYLTEEEFDTQRWLFVSAFLAYPERVMRRLFDESGNLIITLSQEETLLFDTLAKVDIQIRVRFPDGSALASGIIRTSVEKILKDGEI